MTMIETREDLVYELGKLGLTDTQCSIIALDAGSSQCIVDKEYLSTFDIDDGIKIKVLLKVVEFLTGIELYPQDVK